MPRRAIETGVVDLVVSRPSASRTSCSRTRAMRPLSSRSAPRSPRSRTVEDHLASFCNSCAGPRHPRFPRVQGIDAACAGCAGAPRCSAFRAPDEYVEHLEKHGEEIESLARDLLINVTRFFRDQDAWLELQKVAIELIVARKHNDETIRIWVSGCATGEEAYTIALLLLEELRHTQKTVCACRSSPPTSRATRWRWRVPDGIRSRSRPTSLPSCCANISCGAIATSTTASARHCASPIVFSSQDLLSAPPFSPARRRLLPTTF